MQSDADAAGVRGIGSGGGETLPVSDLVARALYDPERGYYARHIAGVGSRGDFATSATLGRVMAAAVAGWVLKEWRGAGERGIGLIEIGPGNGALAKAMRRYLPACHPLRTRHHLVEISPVLRADQERMLGKRVRWHGRIEEALDECDGRALILGHELIDAFPPEVLRWNGGEWERMALHMPASGAVSWQALPLPDGINAENHVAFDPAAWPDGAPPDGQWIECFDSARRWMAEWLPRWRAGSLLWIDYGAGFPELYHRRPGGTLRGYARHQRVEGMEIFRRLGRQDITADINFTDLRRWGEKSGLQTTFDDTQSAFLHNHLPLRTRSRHPTDPALDPAPASAFRALAQTRPPA